MIFIFENGGILARTETTTGDIWTKANVIKDIRRWNNIIFMRKNGILRLFINNDEIIDFHKTSTYKYGSIDTNNMNNTGPARWGAHNSNLEIQNWTHIEIKDMQFYSYAMEDGWGLWIDPITRSLRWGIRSYNHEYKHIMDDYHTQQDLSGMFVVNGHAHTVEIERDNDDLKFTLTNNITKAATTQTLDYSETPMKNIRDTVVVGGRLTWDPHLRLKNHATITNAQFNDEPAFKGQITNVKVDGVTPTSQDFRVNTEIEDEQVNPTVTTLSNNHFVVHWTHSEPFKEFHKFVFNKAHVHNATVEYDETTDVITVRDNGSYSDVHQFFTLEPNTSYTIRADILPFVKDDSNPNGRLYVIPTHTLSYLERLAWTCCYCLRR